MITLIAIIAAMTLIAILAVVTAQRWPNTVTWVHVAVAVLSPIAAETVNLLVH